MIDSAHSLRSSANNLFGVRLSKKEAGALYLRCRAEVRGAPLTGLHFLRYFLRLGDQRRTDLARTKVARQEQQEQLASRYAEEPGHAESYAYTPADTRAALSKLRKAAARFNGDRGTRLTELYAGDLRPHDLRLLLKKELGAAFSAAEVGALCGKLAEDGAEVTGDSLVSSAAFTASFLRLVREEKRAAREQQQEAQRAKTQERAPPADQDEVALDDSFTAEERQQALVKLSNCAGRFDRSSTGAVDLSAFEGLDMTPGVFRQTLLRIGGLRLSPKELAVLVREFARPGTRVVGSTAFLQSFVRAGAEQRALWQRLRAEKLQRTAERRRRREEARRAADGARAAAGGAGFGPEDLQSALERLGRAAAGHSKFSASSPSLEVRPS